MSGETVKPWLNICKYGGSVAEWLACLTRRPSTPQSGIARSIYTATCYLAVALLRYVSRHWQERATTIQTQWRSARTSSVYFAYCLQTLAVRVHTLSLYIATWRRAVPLHLYVASCGPSAQQRGITRSICTATWCLAVPPRLNVASRDPHIHLYFLFLDASPR